MKRQNDISLQEMLQNAGAIYTLQEIGDAMGISRERVRQIESSALMKLRVRLKREDLKIVKLMLRDLNEPRAKVEFYSYPVVAICSFS